MKIFSSVRIWTVVVAIGLIAALPSSADVRKGNGEVGFDFGLTEFDSDLTETGGARLDVRAGYMLSNMFQLEGQIGYSDVDEGYLGTAFVNAVFNFRTSPRFMPYFLVGGGGATMEMDTLDDNGVAGQIAGGFRGFGDQGRIGLRLEFGAMVLDLFDKTTVNGNFTVGFTFALGHHHAHRPPEVKRKALKRTSRPTH